MIYTDNPVSDWETYCNMQERANKEWHEENDPRIQEEIDEIEYKIENLEIDLKNATDENVKWDIECYIEELQSDIERLKKEMAE